MIAVLTFLLGGGAFLLMVASPFLLCGVICLCTRLRTGLWCGWATYLCVNLYLRYGTGITWSIVFQTPHFTPEMNYMRLAIGWVQCLAGVLLIVLTLRSYRKKTAAWNLKHFILIGIDLLLLTGFTLAQSGIVRRLLSQPDFTAERNQHSVFWVISCGDYMRIGILVALLVLVAALIRQWRKDKKSSLTP